MTFCKSEQRSWAAPGGSPAQPRPAPPRMSWSASRSAVSSVQRQKDLRLHIAPGVLQPVFGLKAPFIYRKSLLVLFLPSLSKQRPDSVPPRSSARLPLCSDCTAGTKAVAAAKPDSRPTLGQRGPSSMQGTPSSSPHAVCRASACLLPCLSSHTHREPVSQDPAPSPLAGGE